MKYIAVMSAKGGVGKSSIAIQLAVCLSQRYNTLLIDLDLTGPSVPVILGARERVLMGSALVPARLSPTLSVISIGLMIEETDAVIWRAPKKAAVAEKFLNCEYDGDYVVVDTPPGYSAEHELLFGFNPFVVVVTSPQNVALSDTNRTLEACERYGLRVCGIIENLSSYLCSCGCTTKIFGSKGGEELASHRNVNFLGALPISLEFSKLCNSENFLRDYGSSSYKKLFEAVLERILSVITEYETAEGK